MKLPFLTNWYTVSANYGIDQSRCYFIVLSRKSSTLSLMFENTQIINLDILGDKSSFNNRINFSEFRVCVD